MLLKYLISFQICITLISRTWNLTKATITKSWNLNSWKWPQTLLLNSWKWPQTLLLNSWKWPQTLLQTLRLNPLMAWWTKVILYISHLLSRLLDTSLSTNKVKIRLGRKIRNWTIVITAIIFLKDKPVDLWYTIDFTWHKCPAHLLQLMYHGNILLTIKISW